MKLKLAKTLCVGAALALLGAPAMAQQGPYNGGPGNMQHMEQPSQRMMGGNEHGGGYGDNQPGMQGQMHGEGHDQYGNGYGHGWRDGQHFNGHREMVGDWRHYGLRQPPQGYEWVRDGDQFVLIAIASGIISSIILNSMYH